MVSTYHVGDVGVCAVDGAAGRTPARSTTVKKNLACLPVEQSERLQDLARVGRH